MSEWRKKGDGDWSSKIVVLSLIGVGGLLAASSCQPQHGTKISDDEGRRNQYNTREECEADYSASQCEGQQRAGGGGFFFLGPMYYGNWRNASAGAYVGGGGPGRAALASPDGVVARPVVTQRGGFGATGRSYSGRGG